MNIDIKKVKKKMVRYEERLNKLQDINETEYSKLSEIPISEQTQINFIQDNINQVAQNHNRKDGINNTPDINKEEGGKISIFYEENTEKQRLNALEEETL